MLLSDVKSLNKVLRSPTVVSIDGNRYNEHVDLDIERMYSESPQLSEWPIVYNFDKLYKIEQEEPSCDESQPCKLAWLPSSENIKPDFSPREVNRAEPNVNRTSQLTRILEEIKNNRTPGKTASNGIPLTIYLPNLSSMQVIVKEQCTFGELIEQVLEEHKQSNLQPPLNYDDMDYYEVRIHEGDGEPDRDFAAFEPDKPLKQYDLDEYCLCIVEDRAGEYFTPAGDRFSSPTNQQSVNVFQSMDLAAMNSRDRDRESSVAGTLPGLTNSGKFGRDAGNFRAQYMDMNDSGKSDPRDYLMDDYEAVQTATIRFPNAQQVGVPFDDSTTLRELLPLVAKLHPLTKLRLHTDEYIFVISAQDQKRLHYANQQMEMNARVCTIGTTFFDLQKKTYADTVRVTKVKATTQHDNGPANPQSNRPSEVDNFVFNEATANAYQEWNVVKRNRFGRKQERIFGVDGKKVYNGKRGTFKGGTAQKVQRAERDISSIVNVDILPNDDKTFRITWRDDKDLYDIEYTFDNSRECAEAVAKIRYIRNRDIANARKPSMLKR